MSPERKSRFRSVAIGAIVAMCCSHAMAGGLGGIGVGGAGIGGIGLPGGAAGGLGHGAPGISVPAAPNLPGLPLGPITPGLGSLGTLSSAVSPTLDGIGRPIGSPAVTTNSFGQKIIRGEVLAIEPAKSDLATAERLGFAVTASEEFDSLGLRTVSLAPPDGMSEVQALAALRSADPTGNFDFDHVYDPSGILFGSSDAGAKRLPLPYVRGLTVGMIDAGIDLDHPALARADIETRNVTDRRRPPVTAHGTAVASLLVGEDGAFRGQLPGATLYAVDAFGGDATGGSAVDIVRALDWLAEKRVAVVNASLAGPPNALLAAAVRAFIATGHILVAAAGNAGPAAPPAYPAAYDGVVGVTSVDAQRRLQLDANRGDVAFAALGVKVRAASLGGYGLYTGTSFAAPIVTGRFAMLVSQPDARAVRAARDALIRAAEHIGDRSAYGFGYVGPTALATNAE